MKKILDNIGLGIGDWSPICTEWLPDFDTQSKLVFGINVRQMSIKSQTPSSLIYGIIFE